MKTLSLRTRMPPPARRPLAPPLVPSPKPARKPRAKKRKPLTAKDIKWLKSIGVPTTMIVDAVIRDCDELLAKMKRGR